MRLLSLLGFATAVAGYVVNEGTVCELYPESTTHQGRAVDDAPHIQKAFDLCGTNGTVIFTEDTFNIQTVLNTTNLLNCNVHIKGELKFSANLPYWRSHSHSVVYQNQVTSWLFGGVNVTVKSEEGGWFNGQGQAWYTANRGQSNQPGRPIALTIFNSTNVRLDGLRFIQPQFWAMFVSHSQNVSFTNLFVNATSDNVWPTFNTDGYNSWNSRDLLVENASITNGDDCVAAKGNTTDLLVKNVTCIGSNGMTIGSVGQYPEMPDYVQNITFQDVKCIDCLGAAYIKTWQGAGNDQTLNGDKGGGGEGLVKNITFANFEMVNVGLPIQISQCVYTELSSNQCNTSKIQIEDVTWSNITGTSRFNVGASLYCSEVRPCPGIRFKDVNIASVNNTLGLAMSGTELQSEVWQCANIVGGDEVGLPCNHKAPDDFSQFIYENVS